jgi:hypothetical protein
MTTSASSRAALAFPMLARPLGVPGKSRRACRQVGREHNWRCDES